MAGSNNPFISQSRNILETSHETEAHPVMIIDGTEFDFNQGVNYVYRKIIENGLWTRLMVSD